MAYETPNSPNGGHAAGHDSDRSRPGAGALVLTLAGLLGSGWFVLSWKVAHNTVRDAIGEALGVALAMLIVFSVIGAIRNRDGSTEPDR
jgi:FtsH-binding integral membrane protein